VDPTATAFPHRDEHYDFLILSQWADPAESERNVQWTRSLFEAMEPFFEGGVYVNNLGDEGEDRVREAYGANYERLQALKGKYDPTRGRSGSSSIRRSSRRWQPDRHLHRGP
jgi:hypothetical protein